MVQGKWRRNLPLHLMLLPGLFIIVIYAYGPMVGLLMAFERYIPAKGLFGSQWIGLDNYRYILSIPDIGQIVFNTVFIASMKIIAGLAIPITLSLLLNEVIRNSIKRSIQTVIYMPHFLSWVILGGITIDILSPSSGIVNQIIRFFGFKPVFFLGDPKWFPFTLVATNIWKEAGFGTIIYLAALTSIDPTLYEAAIMDGANRWKQTLHITLPGMVSIIVLMATLSLRDVLNAGFDQVFNLYNALVYDTGDIIDTFVYRLGIVDAHYSAATAAGLFSSVISLIFILVAYWAADRFANYRIF